MKKNMKSKQVLRAGKHYAEHIQAKKLNASKSVEWESLEAPKQPKKATDALNCSCKSIKKPARKATKHLNSARKVTARWENLPAAVAKWESLPTPALPQKQLNSSRSKPGFVELKAPKLTKTVRKPKKSLNSSMQLRKQPAKKLNSCGGNCGGCGCENSNSSGLAEALLQCVPEVQKVAGVLFTLPDAITGQDKLFLAYVDEVDHLVVATPVMAYDIGFTACTVPELCEHICQIKQKVSTITPDVREVDAITPMPVQEPIALPGPVGEVF